MNARAVFSLNAPYGIHFSHMASTSLRWSDNRKWILVSISNGSWSQKWLLPCDFLSFASCHVVLTTLYHNVLPKHAARGNTHALVLRVSEFHSLTLLKWMQEPFPHQSPHPTFPLGVHTSLSWGDNWKWIKNTKWIMRDYLTLKASLTLIWFDTFTIQFGRQCLRWPYQWVMKISIIIRSLVLWKKMQSNGMSITRIDVGDNDCNPICSSWFEEVNVDWDCNCSGCSGRIDTFHIGVNLVSVPDLVFVPRKCT